MKLVVEPICKNGNIIWADVSTFLQRDAENNPLYFITTINDITNRKNAEKEIKIALEKAEESENKLKFIFDTMTEGVALNECIFDEHGEMVDYKVLDVNQAFYRVANYSGEKVIGKLASQIYGLTHQQINLFWKAHKEKNITTHHEMSSPINSNWFYISTSPFVNNKFITAFFDITERKRTEELVKQKNTEIELHNSRLESLLKITQLQTNSIQELLDFALNEAVNLTKSKIGYIYFYDQEKRQFTLNTWSKEVMPECKVMNPQSVYDLDKTGCWGEAVRQRKPIIINDYQAENPYKKKVHRTDTLSLKNFLQFR